MKSFNFYPLVESFHLGTFSDILLELVISRGLYKNFSRRVYRVPRDISSIGFLLTVYIFFVKTY